MKYLNATMWILFAWTMRNLRLPRRWVHEVEDQATMRMFDCSLDFAPIGRTAPPPGWACEHVSIMSGGSLVSAGCGNGCKMEPIASTPRTAS